MPTATGASPAQRGALLNLAAGALIIGILTSFTLASRLAYATALLPSDLMAIRFATSGLLLLPFAVRLGLPTLLGSDSLRLAIAGGVGFAGFAYVGLAFVPASHAGALMHGALPFFTFAIGATLGRTKADGRRMVGALLMATALVTVVWDIAGGGTSHLLGAALVLAASATWSAFGILAARLKRDPIGTAATISVLSAVIYLPIYVLFLDRRIGDVAWGAILLQVVIQGMLVGAVSVFAYSWAISRLGALGTAVATSMVPAVTALGAMPVLAEYPSTPVAIGLLLLATGSLLVLGVRTRATSIPPIGLSKGEDQPPEARRSWRYP